MPQKYPVLQGILSRVEIADSGVFSLCLMNAFEELGVMLFGVLLC